MKSKGQGRSRPVKDVVLKLAREYPVGGCRIEYECDGLVYVAYEGDAEAARGEVNRHTVDLLETLRRAFAREQAFIDRVRELQARPAKARARHKPVLRDLILKEALAFRGQVPRPSLERAVQLAVERRLRALAKDMTSGLSDARRSNPTVTLKYVRDTLAAVSKTPGRRQKPKK